ncbi:unnamed protein product [Oppiella nova]|uniref:5'-nucleotidase domain-containing protein 3 n=1 Tax=Oppiella nova TaxID=334625 RepID=A0A7R9LFA1_9ACAR|nr:unnamed protein product [Oppiella nova]CAG2162305.1 unnamed protein product [Oppiella nova]
MAFYGRSHALRPLIANQLKYNLLSNEKNFTKNVLKSILRRNSSNIKLSDLSDRYKTQFNVVHTASSVEPHFVFANNELDLSDIEVYGFDYDYTLAVYKESLMYLIYDLGRKVLIDKYKYPKDILKLDYIPDFAIRGLHFDIENGLLMKIDSFHQIQLGSVYRGLTPIDDNEVLNLYNGNYVPQKLIRSKAGGEQLPMKQLNDLFSVPEICLLSNVTEYFIKNNIPYHPEILFNDTQVLTDDVLRQ